MRLAVTRPEPEAQQTATLLRARGHEVIVSPLLRIELEPAADITDGEAGVVMTSANAARAVAAHPGRNRILERTVYAVGRRTANAARAAGFVSVISAEGNTADLVRLIAARLGGSRARLLYLAGEDRAADLAVALAPHGVAVKTVTVYRAVAVPTLSPALREALAAGVLDGVLHYSRRSATAFAAAARAAGLLVPARAVRHYCLAPEVAGPLEAAGAALIAIAPRPEESALLELLSMS
jgi:uroporphyrinogen-III synthase